MPFIIFQCLLLLINEIVFYESILWRIGIIGRIVC